MDTFETRSTLDESALLQHYDLLEESGLLEQVKELESDVRFQREIIEEAFEVFRRRTVDDLIDHLISRILDRFVPSYLVFLLQVRSHSNELTCIAYRHLKPSDADCKLESLDRFEAFFERYPQPVSFSLFEHETDDEYVVGRLREMETEMLVPVLGPGGLMGIIFISRKLVEGDYTNQEITFINRLMQFGSVALQNIIHYVSASRDAKTGLYNHSFFMARLEQELGRHERYGNVFSLLMCDLDHFKQVNDKHGHPAGDAVLTDFARLLEDTTRTVDIVARYGGEEFVVLLPETCKRGAWLAAERIRHAVEEHRFGYDGVDILLACSVGGCCVSSLDRPNADDVMKTVDSALYWAKEHGRNRSALYRAGLFFMGRYYYSGEAADVREATLERRAQ